VEIRALRASDDRSQFRSGDEALDRFFHQYAGQNQFRHHLGVTYVAADSDRIVGFAANVDVAANPSDPQGRSTALSTRLGLSS
jgi:hypothetical protein